MKKGVTSTIMAMEILLNHLFSYGIKPEHITIQTDNGAEFSGARIHHNKGFKKVLEKHLGVKHRFIPPRCPNANADVEVSRKLIENEFYAREHFQSKKDFMLKAATYQFYFNFMRKNSYKNWNTPVQILLKSNINPKIAYLPPVIVNNFSINIDYFSSHHVYLKMYHHLTLHSDFGEYQQPLRFELPYSKVSRLSLSIGQRASRPEWRLRCPPIQLIHLCC